MLDSRWWLRLENRVRSFGATGAEPEPDPIRPRDVIHLSIYYCDSKKKENGLKIHLQFFFWKSILRRVKGEKQSVVITHDLRGKLEEEDTFLTWGHMKQKRTARGHLCVTHEVKAKHDLSSDVCKFSKTKTTWKVNTFLKVAQISQNRRIKYPEIWANVWFT